MLFTGEFLSQKSNLFTSGFLSQITAEVRRELTHSKSREEEGEAMDL